jgi:hypothetical protein
MEVGYRSEGSQAQGMGGPRENGQDSTHMGFGAPLAWLPVTQGVEGGLWGHPDLGLAGQWAHGPSWPSPPGTSHFQDGKGGQMAAGTLPADLSSFQCWADEGTESHVYPSLHSSLLRDRGHPLVCSTGSLKMQDPPGACGQCL